LSKLADVATGNALISGGVGAAPTYGKIGLSTHVDGTLGVGNGGTGQTTYTDGQLLIGNTSGGLTKNTLSAGTGISITNGNGTITIASTGSTGTVSFEYANANMNGYNYSLAYDGNSRLSVVTYAVPSHGNLIKTFTYVGELLSTIVFTQSTDAITFIGLTQTTKTFTYDGNNILTGVAYT
jgi:hypothetical protein